MIPVNESKQNKLVLKLCVTALLAALVAASAQPYVLVPAGPLGEQRLHLGNALCALSGILLGPWWGGVASGIGSVFFDLFNPAYVAEAPITFLTKGMYGVVSGLVFYRGFKGKYTYPALTVASLCAAVTYAVLYLVKNYFYNGLLIHGLEPAAAWLGVVSKVPSAVFNGVVAVVFAPIIGLALYKALKAAHLDRLLA